MSSNRSLCYRTAPLRCALMILAAGVLSSACGSDGSGGVSDPVSYFALTLGNSWSYSCEGCDNNALQASAEVVELDTRNFPDVTAHVWRLAFQGFMPVSRWFEPRTDGLYLLQEEGRGVEVPDEGVRTFAEPLRLIPAPVKAGQHTVTVDVSGTSEEHRIDVAEATPAADGPAAGAERWRVTWTIKPADGSLRVSIYDFVPEFGFLAATLSEGAGRIVLESTTVTPPGAGAE